MEVLCTKNYKTLFIEIEEDLNKWRVILSTWIGRLDIISMSVFFNLIYKFNTISISKSNKRIFIWKLKS